MSVVREDANGLYIVLNGHKNRPGDVTGYAHAYDMSDGGLKAGNKVKAYHVSQSPMIRITLENGDKLLWRAREQTY